MSRILSVDRKADSFYSIFDNYVVSSALKQDKDYQIFRQDISVSYVSIQTMYGIHCVLDLIGKSVIDITNQMQETIKNGYIFSSNGSSKLKEIKIDYEKIRIGY